VPARARRAGPAVWPPHHAQLPRRPAAAERHAGARALSPLGHGRHPYTPSPAPRLCRLSPSGGAAQRARMGASMRDAFQAVASAGFTWSLSPAAAASRQLPLTSLALEPVAIDTEANRSLLSLSQAARGLTIAAQARGGDHRGQAAAQLQVAALQGRGRGQGLRAPLAVLVVPQRGRPPARDQAQERAVPHLAGAPRQLPAPPLRPLRARAASQSPAACSAALGRAPVAGHRRLCGHESTAQ